MSEDGKKHKSIPEMMSIPGGLRITKDGQWLHDGGKFTHEKVQQYFEARLRFSKEHGSYVVEDKGRCVPVEVEDTAFFVRTIDTIRPQWVLLLSDGSSEPFDPANLEVGPEGVFYAMVKSCCERARLLRPAWQALVPAIEASGTGYRVVYRGESHALKMTKT